MAARRRQGAESQAMKKAAIYVVGALLAWWAFSALQSSHRAGLSSACPDIQRGVIWVPDDHADMLATLLNAADVLNYRMGVCVIEGGWGSTTRSYYITVQEPGKKPEIRRYSSVELRKLADLGKR
jgi:hypothetical protein